MEWFKNKPVRVKMLLSFSIVIAIMVGLVIFAFTQINSITDDFDYAINHPKECQVQMLTFRGSLRDLRRIVATMVMWAPDGDAAKIDDLAAETKNSFTEGFAAIDEFSKLIGEGIMSPKAEEALKIAAEIRVMFDRYDKEIMTPVAAAAREGDRAGALQFVGVGGDLIKNIRESTDDVLALAEASANMYVETADSTAQKAVVFLWIIAGVAAFMAIGVAMYIAGLISKPLVDLSGFMKKAGATGDLTMTPQDVENVANYGKMQDEIGATVMGCVTSIQHVTQIAKELEAVANGDLTIDVNVLSASDTMGKSLSHMLESLNHIFEEIHASANQVSTGSSQIADGAQALAQGATVQAASIEELSSSIADIAFKTKNNAETAEKTSSLAQSIMTNAERGSRQMDEMVGAVSEINEASQSISKVIKVIEDIAFQTNILALNAAVEAARAGQHGKGFAVVAEEVRNLAAKSAEAASSTSSLIQNSMEKSESGSRIAVDTAASLTEIVSGINESNGFIRRIADASEEQSVGISQINVGMEQVSKVIQQNSATAEESAAASEEMSGQSAVLQELISQFKIKNQGIGTYRSSQPALGNSGFGNSGSQRLSLGDSGGSYSGGKY